jgi:hypothetical protein
MLSAAPKASAFAIDPPIVVPNEHDLHKAMLRKSPRPELVRPPADWSPTDEELQDLGYTTQPGEIEELKPSAAPSASPTPKPSPGAVPTPPTPPGAPAASAAPAAPGAPAPKVNPTATAAPQGSAPTLEAPRLEMPKVPPAPGVNVGGPGGI